MPVFDISEDSKAPKDIEFREAYQKAQTMDVGDLVIRDVFDVRGTLKKGKNDVISFNLSSYGEVVVLYEYVDGEWKEIPEERIKWNSDGTIYVTIIDLCPLVIAVDPNFKVGNENTNDNNNENLKGTTRTLDMSPEGVVHYDDRAFRPCGGAVVDDYVLVHEVDSLGIQRQCGIGCEMHGLSISRLVDSGASDHNLLS